MSATMTRTPLKRDELYENVQASPRPHKVDRKKRIIYGVKICGLLSRNGVRYTPKSLSLALALYEDCYVNQNHVDKKNPDVVRDVVDRFGSLHNVRVEGDGLYGDIHYLESAPNADMILEAAERMPHLFGLSHHAYGDGYFDEQGIKVIEEIYEVRSVDIVTQSATTETLFEEENMAGEALTRPAEEVVVPPPPPVISVEEAINNLEQAVLNDPTMREDDKTRLKMVGEVMKLKQKLMGGPEEEVTPPVDETELTEQEEDEEEERDEDEQRESLQLKRQMKALENERLALRLCTRYGVKSETILLESLVALGDELKMIEHLKYVVKQRGPTPKGRRRRASRSTQLQESHVPSLITASGGGGEMPPEDIKELADFVRGNAS